MKQPERKRALLLLADGSLFEGYSIGKQGTSGGEISPVYSPDHMMLSGGLP